MKVWPLTTILVSQHLLCDIAFAFHTPTAPRRTINYVAGCQKQNHGTSAALQSTPDSDSESSNIIMQGYHLYVDYYKRLWSDTDTEHRCRKSQQRARDAVLHVKNMVSSKGTEEYLWKETSGSAPETEDLKKEEAVFKGLDESVRLQMEESCDLLLDQLDKQQPKKERNKRRINVQDYFARTPFTTNDKSVIPPVMTGQQEENLGSKPLLNKSQEEIFQKHDVYLTSPSTGMIQIQTERTKALTDPQPTRAAVSPKKKKNGRSVLFGATMGLSVALWVYSGDYIFTAIFTLMTALGQLEYYRMVMNAGIYPARRISVLGACATFITALFAPDLHQIVLPVFSTYAMIWFLTTRRSISTISEIATTFTGMFYLGYIPSFWVRIRQIGGDMLQPTRLSPIVKPIFQKFNIEKVPKFIPKYISFPINVGSNFIFWTWLCIAFSDVGGYFVGRKYGKTKLGAISGAAGKTSPNKTVEGVIGGCAFSLVLATLGAWIQKWPCWYLLGPVHGVLLALLGLVGDLTASMLKRDAGLKDFGDIIPEHGGIMDRVDSYIFTAPYGWLMCGYVIPWLRRIADAQKAASLLAV